MKAPPTECVITRYEEEDLREGEKEVPGHLAAKGVVGALTQDDARAKEENDAH